jgi:RNase P protein component
LISKWSKNLLLDVNRYLNIFFAYNLLGYDKVSYYAPSGEETVRIGLVVAKKYFFTAKN